MSAVVGDPHFPSLPGRKRSDATTKQGEDGGDTCRICRSEGTPAQPLFYPCKCSGSIKFVHQECLMEWLSHSQKKYCELCKTPFRFTKLYHQSMPEQVPFLLFLRKAGLHTVKAFSRWCRYVLVIFVWLCWLPWTIRQIWRGLFWIADGSWMANYEVHAALQGHSGQGNASALLHDVLTNVTLSHSSSIDSMAYIKSLAGLLSFFDVAATIRWTLRFLLTVVLSSGTLSKWGHGFFSFTPFPRPPSLLSDVKTINSATNSPLFNNAILDVLEGQLICLTIVAVFILVFLIREWVINQQPLAHIPDAEQQNDLPAGPQRVGQGVQNRVQDLPPANVADIQGGNGLVDLENRPRAQPRTRRRATENNILVSSNPGVDLERPALPIRAASLIPALQEMEDNVRQLEELAGPVDTELSDVLAEEVRAPPLQRGLFDEVGQIRRDIEERIPVTDISQPEDGPQNPGAGSLHDAMSGSQPLTAPFTFNASSSTSPANLSAETSNFTFSIGNTLNAADLTDSEGSGNVDIPQKDGNNSSDSEVDSIHTPGSSDTSQHMIPVMDQEVTPASTDEAADSEIHEPIPRTRNDTIWTTTTNWLWQIDDTVPTPPPPNQDTDDAEIIRNINEQPPFVPVVHNRADNVVLNLPDAAAAAPQIREPNIQNGVNVNDLNAVDDAEDLEGILELIGMEGPIAGMIQNIIFSVFLISLTLSASVWCPYIWGKIALLLVAHPVGVFIRAPLYLVSKTADIIIDLFLLLLGGVGIALSSLFKILKVISMPLVPSISNFFKVRFLDDYFYSLSARSSGRLEKVVTGTFFNLRPDLPTFSMQSHHVLRVLTAASTNVTTQISDTLLAQSLNLAEKTSWYGVYQMPVAIGSFARSFPVNAKTWFTESQTWFTQLQHDLRPLSFAKSTEIDYSLVSWSSREKITCIILGYILFAIAGYVYLQVAHLILGLKKDEKVPGVSADILRQAGGVLKVVIIIGIEMIVFPLYCGTMLDVALLPLFEGATLQSRLAFFINAPVTALFVHWFLGTCYMFHFALFVSMCRKVLRKGVLYFIRDPDDPTFHPVRDVLERPVATQLGKIAFSALVYGSLLIVCLGGVVLGLSHVGNVLPIHWSAREPLMKVPGDIVFYNFMLPFIVRKIDISDKVSAIFQWWFTACAAGLRLTDFLFGIDSEQEKQPGLFLWTRFFNKLRLHELGDASILATKDNLKNLERLAKHPERLLLFENIHGKADEEAVRKVFGSEPKFKLISLSKKDSHVLIKFDRQTDLNVIKQVAEKEIREENSHYKIKFVKDMNIQVYFLRNTPVQPSAGMYVRAPAKDSVRIPKGTGVFLQVDENDKVVGDSQDDGTEKDDRFSKIFIPTHFKARISTFITLVWVFAAVLGLIFTIGPLLIGRYIIKGVTGLNGPVNDLYAVTIGMHAMGATIYTLYKIVTQYRSATEKTRSYFTNTRQALPHIISALQKLLGITYLSVALGIVLPMALSILSELYIHVPVYAYVVANRNATAPSKSEQESASQQAPISHSELPIIHLLQTWTLGILYLRIVIRVLTTMPHTNTQAATAIRAIVRNGYTRPDVRLASRALILPILTTCIVLLGLPFVVAQVVIALSPQDLTDQQKISIFQYSYPAHLLVAIVAFIFYRMKTRIEAWRIKIRDEVYLIGERLHNFPNSQEKENNSDRKRKKSITAIVKEGRSTAKVDENLARAESSPAETKGKEKEKTTTTSTASPGSAEETSDEEEMADLQEALERSNFDFLNLSNASHDHNSPQASSARSDHDRRRRDSVVDDIEEFKNITGLEGLATSEELGDTTLALLAAQRDHEFSGDSD